MVDCKKLAKLTIVTFLLLFVTDFIIHGKLLQSIYMGTQDLWRSEDEMHSMMLLMMLGRLVLSYFFSWIFLHGYKGTGIMEGVRYGLFIGGLFAGHALIVHAVAPYPTNLTVAWIVAGFAQMAILGAVIAKLAK